jgi:dATP pyrophosphohydrolase
MTGAKMASTSKKQPVSVLVVIYSSDLDVLLLERADHPDYWQSVTGSRDGNESMRDTAIREVYEETGIDATRYQLSDWQFQNEYEIYPHWRHRYPEGITRNIEHVFGLQLPKCLPVVISPREHLNYQWISLQDAADKVFSPTNRAMILALPEHLDRKNI